MKAHVNRCIGKIEEDMQDVRGAIEEVKGEDQRRFEEVEDKVQRRSETSKRDSAILRSNQTIFRIHRNTQNNIIKLREELLPHTQMVY
ncbi:hypothetical protein AVEN_87463-1 [Araneus ventricosus]|uniref:Uncharacterized protein n=1 Tax=Araneus ventricosus TaxID=182803 RepID=A0A4Y2W1N2_ARAVE|nr:hypothetical protein AVEN_87463-1 [Araneus ventricosus]